MKKNQKYMMVQGEVLKYDTKQDVHKPLSPLVQITSQVIGTTPCSHTHLCTYYHPATILFETLGYR